MPEMGGFEATAEIRTREIETGQHIPIVAMTAHAMKGDRERCLLAGMDHYIPKPIHARLLYEVISRLKGNQEEKSASVFSAVNLAGMEELEALVDLDTALERLGGDHQLLETVVQRFLEECPSLMTKLRSAVFKQDAKALELAAHTVRGLVANFGASTACELALKLELIGRGRNLSESAATATALETELKRVIAAVVILVDEKSALCITNA